MNEPSIKKNVLVIAAHADDEALGCAGTIAKHIADGDVVNIIFMTNGLSARAGIAKEDHQERNEGMINAMKTLGVNHYQCFDFPDNKMDSVPLLTVVKGIEQVINEYLPNIIYTHFAYDLNIDHQKTHQAVMTACRPIIGSSVKEIYSFEVLSSTEWQSSSQPSFRSQYIVDISSFWHKKERALLCYQQELRDFPHSRSLACIEALATLRGATHGFAKAEAFQVERILKS
ncbi:MAG: LmbE family N-acetylglucosaminyl deacetylase [Flavobacteriales bacterium]|jgi:LmbE family N-acetylglucosaminyl deacetylase